MSVFKHQWNGTILTITSDSGTSSADLKGSRGDLGPRGPQGPAGVSVGEGGSVDLSGYATEKYVDDKLSNLNFDNINLDNYYTKQETLALIPDIDDIDLSNYYTKSEVNTKISNIKSPVFSFNSATGRLDITT